MTTTHVIEVYEPTDYIGQNPIHGEAVGVIKTQDRSEFFLINLEEPFDVNGEEVKQVILQPRYFGDKIARVTHDICTVSIMRVKEDCPLSLDEYFQLSAVAKWGCGKVNPSKYKVN